jgi:transcriptional regulator with XRE-family HTH domain
MTTKELPFSTTGLHPDQIIALREHAGLSQAEFGALLGTSASRVEDWEASGLPTGPEALALRAVARGWGYELPQIEGLDDACAICGAPGYHVAYETPVCRSCYLNPRESLSDQGFVIRDDVDPSSGRRRLEVGPPSERAIALPSALFGPEDWKAAVKKWRTDEPQVGHPMFDDAVYIEYIEEDEWLEDPVVRELIGDMVRFGEVELFGTYAEIRFFKGRSLPPLDRLVLDCAILIHRLARD